MNLEARVQEVMTLINYFIAISSLQLNSRLFEINSFFQNYDEIRLLHYCIYCSSENDDAYTTQKEPFEPSSQPKKSLRGHLVAPVRLSLQIRTNASFIFQTRVKSPRWVRSAKFTQCREVFFFVLQNHLWYGLITEYYVELDHKFPLDFRRRD